MGSAKILQEFFLGNPGICCSGSSGSQLLCNLLSCTAPSPFPSQQLILHNPPWMLKVCFTDWKAPLISYLSVLMGFDSKPKEISQTWRCKIPQCWPVPHEFKSQSSQDRFKDASSQKLMSLYGLYPLKTEWGKVFYWLNNVHSNQMTFQVTS